MKLTHPHPLEVSAINLNPDSAKAQRSLDHLQKGRLAGSLAAPNARAPRCQLPQSSPKMGAPLARCGRPARRPLSPRPPVKRRAGRPAPPADQGLRLMVFMRLGERSHWRLRLMAYTAINASPETSRCQQIRPDTLRNSTWQPPIRWAAPSLEPLTSDLSGVRRGAPPIRMPDRWMRRGPERRWSRRRRMWTRRLRWMSYK
jgi:hypothetical protein